MICRWLCGGAIDWISSVLRWRSSLVRAASGALMTRSIHYGGIFSQEGGVQRGRRQKTHHAAMSQGKGKGSSEGGEIQQHGGRRNGVNDVIVQNRNGAAINERES
ncbi:hypothetical protein L484_024298 [Morus notabilis]|uniref:Uncharacterized protein n=1 Tax=Morus notabilis TaxID=981085 RepID=W9QH70_9ROSA|nr:hypothetical protein L484_024298 [Morus notabilis]